jgi:dCTP deaminase
MPFWSSQKLRSRIPAERLIEPYNESRVVHSAYEMGVGSEAFVTSNPSDSTQVHRDKKIILPPGQFGLLVTRETVYVPTTALAFISIRARIKFQGLVNVSGFHVDPGFRGQLKFAVYNAGSRSIVLDQGQPIFMIWFADLSDSDDSPYPNREPSELAITADDVARIHGEVASPAELKKQLDELRADVDQKFHATEHMRLTNRHLLMALVVAAAGLWAKTCIDAADHPQVPSASTSAPSTVTPSTGSSTDTVSRQPTEKPRTRNAPAPQSQPPQSQTRP